ncbi:hypothetical protein RDABS01_000075, partial [Bienertia sinuspersici]
MPNLSERTLVIIMLVLAVIIMALFATALVLVLKYDLSPSSSHTHPPSPSISPSPNLSVHGAFAAYHYLNNTSSYLESSSSMKSNALFLMKDSSVDCGDNALFYHLLCRNLSLFLCSENSVSSHLPYILVSVGIFALILCLPSYRHRHRHQHPSSIAPSPHVSVNRDFVVNITKNNMVSSSMILNVNFLMGDSSIDYGEDALFYPLLHNGHHFSPCSNNSVSSSIPQILGTLLAMLTTALVAAIVHVSVGIYHSSNNQSSPSNSSSVSFQGSLFDQDIVDNSSSFSPLLNPRAFFVIGDSSVDCGGNTLFYPLLRNNRSLLPCSNASGSTVIPHFLATKMGLPNIPTFYEQNGTIEGILNGLNYGSAQATILPSPNTPNFQSLNQQLRQTFETIQLLQLQLGQQQAQTLINSSVFYLSLGKDDYINFLFENSSFSSGFNGDVQLVPRLLVDEMTNALKDLYDAGARKIVGMGIYPLGCAPRAVVNWYFMTGRNRRRLRGCVNEINQMILQHNQLLSDHIIDLNLEFSDAQFVFCDVYQGVMEIMSNPQKYGKCERSMLWKRVAWSSNGVSKPGNGLQSKLYSCMVDFYNPSEAVNSLLADSAWSGQPLGDICHPLSIQKL